ncbi:MAG: VanW family protein [Oscillospiraceae bacterium]|jgi:vancomycin resistance protein VanW|nr:VanW family protein [Oscillospiraceae bacterium]
MPRKLFCEISPLTYKISREKCIFIRRLRNAVSGVRFAATRSDAPLPCLVYEHKSLIRRKLGNVDSRLQDNKAVNLSIAAPTVSGILVQPGETFSFWKLVGRTSSRRGYLDGLNISRGQVTSGVGGGMCQFTNLIHWMVLHSELTVTEHHHHERLDLFPDSNRLVPFGTGTAIVYNYIDYRFRNDTNRVYQLIIYSDGEYLRGELRASLPERFNFLVYEDDAYFYEQAGTFYRHNKIYRRTVDSSTGEAVGTELILENNAKVCYDSKFIDKEKIKWTLKN